MYYICRARLDIATCVPECDGIRSKMYSMCLTENEFLAIYYCMIQYNTDMSEILRKFTI
jgi:hypothetical protein